MTLARPKTFQEAESLARMKELVANNQSVPDTQSVINQMEAMLQKLMTHSVSQTSNNCGDFCRTDAIANR